MIFIIIKKRLNEQQGFHLAHLLPNVTIKSEVAEYLVSRTPQANPTALSIR